jgi:hypothetical protein
MDGKVHYFDILSSYMPWEIIDIDDPKGIITNPQAIKGMYGGSATVQMSKTTVDFALIDDNSRQKIKQATAAFIVKDGNGIIHRWEFNANAVYVLENENLVVWPVDQPAGYTWYIYADVQPGFDSKDIPPFGVPADKRTYPNLPQAAPNSCASLDPNDKDLWRLPTQQEMEIMLNYFYQHGGTSAFGFQNVEFTGAASQTNVPSAYWTATSHSAQIAYGAAYSIDLQKAWSTGISKNISTSNIGGPVYARCVRTK